MKNSIKIIAALVIAICLVSCDPPKTTGTTAPDSLKKDSVKVDATKVDSGKTTPADTIKKDTVKKK